MMFSWLLRHWLAVNFPDSSSVEGLKTTMGGIGGILIVWHLFCLIQLKPFNRWFSIVIFGWWMLFCSGRAYVCFYIVENPLRPVLSYLIFDAISIVCIWYLVRKKFRDFAVQFVSEREKEKNLRRIQKRVGGGL